MNYAGNVTFATTESRPNAVSKNRFSNYNKYKTTINLHDT